MLNLEELHKALMGATETDCFAVGVMKTSDALEMAEKSYRRGCHQAIVMVNDFYYGDPEDPVSRGRLLCALEDVLRCFRTNIKMELPMLLDSAFSEASRIVKKAKK